MTDPNPDAPHVLVLEARFYDDIADELAKGALHALKEAGAGHERCAVPGAFELPAALRYAMLSPEYYSARRRFDGFVVLGCVIRGETSHYDLICTEVARALQSLAVEHALALGFGLLTVENQEQAWARADVRRRNLGRLAARACLDMIDLKRHFRLDLR